MTKGTDTEGSRDLTTEFINERFDKSIIRTIDSYKNCLTQIDTGKWVFSKPIEASGLLKLKIRIIYALSCLTGKAIAVRFWSGHDKNGNKIN